MSAKAQTDATPDRAPLIARGKSGLLQRKCACGQHTIGGEACAECTKGKSNLQRNADSQLAPDSGLSLSRVAGLNEAACVASRQKGDKALNEITTAFRIPEERILNSITRFQKKAPDIMMAELRELCRMLFGTPEADKIGQRPTSKNDSLGKAFQLATSKRNYSRLLPNHEGSIFSSVAHAT